MGIGRTEERVVKMWLKKLRANSTFKLLIFYFLLNLCCTLQSHVVIIIIKKISELNEYFTSSERRLWLIFMWSFLPGSLSTASGLW